MNQAGSERDGTTQSVRPLLSVIVPHLNQPGDLELCLASLDRQTIDRSSFEIIVVDNGSSVSPDAVVARHANARLLRETRPGPGLARNLGVAAARGDILCFIDADCRAHPDWLRNSTQALDAAPPGTILGGDVRIWRNRRSRFTALEAYESVFTFRFKLYIERHGYAGTCNMAVRRADFPKVGPFAGIHLAEDVEWGIRARAAGFVFRYVADMVVFHPARPTMREICVKWDRHIQHDLNMARGGRAWLPRWLARAAAILVSPAVDSVTVLTSQHLFGVAARIKAIALLFAIRAYRAWRMVALLFTNKGIVWNRDVAVDPLRR